MAAVQRSGGGESPAAAAAAAAAAGLDDDGGGSKEAAAILSHVGATFQELATVPNGYAVARVVLQRAAPVLQVGSGGNPCLDECS